MPACSFCQRAYEFPKGLTLALNDGVVLHFCSSKCRKNWKLGRKSKKVNWVRKMKHTETDLVEKAKEQPKEKEAEKTEEKKSAEEKKVKK